MGMVEIDRVTTSISNARSILLSVAQLLTSHQLVNQALRGKPGRFIGINLLRNLCYWRFTGRWNALVLDGVVAGLFWTGGIFLPAAERDEYTLAFTEDGELAVNFVGRLTGTFFLVFPMYIKGEQVWFVYDQVESGDLSGEGNR